MPSAVISRANRASLSALLVRWCGALLVAALMVTGFQPGAQPTRQAGVGAGRPGPAAAEQQRRHEPEREQQGADGQGSGGSGGGGGGRGSGGAFVAGRADA